MAEISSVMVSFVMNETTATNAEFKFNCPACGQHIAVALDWCDWQISCPSCRTSITVPPRPKDRMKVKQALPPYPRIRSGAGEEAPDAGGSISEFAGSSGTEPAEQPREALVFDSAEKYCEAAQLQGES